jgi:VWFA-related protein
MRRSPLGILAPVMCAAAAALRLFAQQPSVTFRTEVNFVEVHAIVTDARGAFVKDLTLEDFEVYEDGRLQKPAAFSLIDLPVERPFVPVHSTEPLEPDVRVAARTFEGRIYLLLLDDLHTAFTRTQHVRDVARRFVQQYLGTNDLAAVVYTSGRQEAGQELTANRPLLLAAIDRFQGRKLPSAGAEKLAVHLRQVGTDEALADEPQRSRTSEGLQKARSIRDPYDAERGLNARRALESVENVARWLADVQGRRKALLFFSEGLDYDIYEPFNRGSASSLVAEAQEAIGAAQRANVNVYAIDPRGLSQFGELIDISARSDYPQLEYGTFRGFLRELLLSQESLISLSDETGGLAVVNAGDVAGGLGRIVLDNSRYYLLGYYSDSKRWSRKFLKIDVRVRRPGLQVRARRGFLPPDQRAVARAREADVKTGTSQALRAALSKPVPVGDFPLRVFAAPFKGTANNASVLVAVEIDGTSLRFQERDGRFNEKVEVSIVATDHRAKVQGSDRQEFDLKLFPQTHQRVSQTGVRMLSRLELPPARYQIRVGAHETTGGAVAMVPYDLDVPDYAKLPFALSGILITSPAAESLVTANPDPQLKEVFPGPPAVIRRFTPKETLTCYAEVYEQSHPSAHEIALVTTVRDPRTGRTTFQVEERRSVAASEKGRTDGFTMKLPLDGLSPGLYVLRLEAASTAGSHRAHRELPFEVR